jgi:hypothetical protein
MLGQNTFPILAVIVVVMHLAMFGRILWRVCMIGSYF